MPSARFPSNSVRKPKHGKWRGLCHLFLPSLSHKSIKHLKTQESTSTRVPSWLEASGKALVEHCIVLLNILFLFLEEIVFFHPIDIRSDYGTCFSQYDVTEVTRATSEQKSLWAGALLSSSLPSPTRSERSQTENFPSARIPDNMKQRQSWPMMVKKPIFCYQCWDFRDTARPTSSES